MLEALSVRPHICKQIRSGPLGQWLDDFVDVLTSRGYATCVIRGHVRAAAIFSGWLERQRIAAGDIDEPLVARFIDGLPRRRAQGRRNGRASELAAGVNLLAGYLWTRGVAARCGPASAACETDQWLQHFDDHLVHVHGLVVGTRPGSPCRRLQRLCRPGRASSVRRHVGRQSPPPGRFFGSSPLVASFPPASWVPCRRCGNGSTPRCLATCRRTTCSGCWPR